MFNQAINARPCFGLDDNNRSWLRARGLAEYPSTGFVRATELLFPEDA